MFNIKILKQYNFNLLFMLWGGCFIWFLIEIFDKSFALWGALGSLIGLLSLFLHRKWLANDALSPLGVYQIAMTISWYIPAIFFLESYATAELAMYYVFLSHLATEFALIFIKSQCRRVEVQLANNVRVNFYRIHVLFVFGVFSFVCVLIAFGVRDPFEVITRMQEIRILLASDGLYYVKSLMQLLILFPTIYYGVLLARRDLSREKVRHYIVLLFAVCLLAFPLGSRAMFIVPFITLVAAYNIERSPINVSIFLPFILVLLIPLYLFVVIRTNYQNNSDTDWDNLISRALDFSDPGLIFASAAESFFGRLAIIDNLADFLNSWDWKIDFLISIPQFISQPIPRGLWADKPYLFNMYATKFTEPYLFSMRISETIGFIAEALYNAGLVGVILFSFCFGWLICILQNQYVKRRHNIFYQILYVQLFLWPTAWISEGLINSSANTLLLLTIFVNFIYWKIVTKKAVKKMVSQEM